MGSAEQCFFHCSATGPSLGVNTVLIPQRLMESMKEDVNLRAAILRHDWMALNLFAIDCLLQTQRRRKSVERGPIAGLVAHFVLFAVFEFEEYAVNNPQPLSSCFITLTCLV